MAADMNPRVLRTQLEKWIGKKVMIGTTDLHYVSGIVYSLDGTELKVSVNGRLVMIPAHMVANIKEAPALQAEYVK